MSAQTIHMCISVRGVLSTWKTTEWKRALKTITKKDGTRYQSINDLKSAFFDELAKGHEVIPLGECDNFDWKTGCKGHPVTRAADGAIVRDGE